MGFKCGIVGLPNVGKSTLMNVLSKSDLFAENKLFATLDTTVRKVVVRNLPFLLSDTVGFIRKLPHQLIESFKSTLDEVRDSDVLIHVVDLSHESYQEQISIVNETLNSILDCPKPVIICFNKIDLLSSSEYKRQLNFWSKSENEVVFISAQKKQNVQNFKSTLFKLVQDLHFIRFPFNKTRINY